MNPPTKGDNPATGQPINPFPSTVVSAPIQSEVNQNSGIESNVSPTPDVSTQTPVSIPNTPLETKQELPSHTGFGNGDPNSAVVSIQGEKRQSKKSIILIIVLTLLIICLLFGAYYFLILRKTKTPTSTVSNIIPTEVVSSITPVVDSNVNENLTFYSRLNRFSLQYPDPTTILEVDGVVSLSYRGEKLLQIKKNALLETSFVTKVNEIVKEDPLVSGTGLTYSTILLGNNTYTLINLPSEDLYLLNTNDGNYLEIYFYKSINTSLSQIVSNILSSLKPFSLNEIATCSIVGSTSSEFIKSYCSGEMCNYQTDNECLSADVLSIDSGNLSEIQTPDGEGDCVWSSSGFAGSCTPKYK